MHSSAMRRRAAAPSPGRNRRLLAVFAGLVVLGGTITVTQLASAQDNDTAACAEAETNAETLRGDRGRDGRGGHRHRRPSPTEPPEEVNVPPEEAPGEEAPGEEAPGEEAPGEEAPGEEAPGEEAPGEEAPGEEAPGEEAPGEEAPGEEVPPAEDCEEGEGGEQAPPPNNGLDVLGQDCAGSNLNPHDGFQNGDRCVSTAMGEVGDAARNPSLLITRAPQRVRVNQAFELQVSTRNLVRDRFLGAAAGGYYLESSFLTDEGIQRGHFHAACRMLESTRVAPDPEPVPAFFRAVEDGGGGANADTVTVEVTGLPETGIAQCAVWAGDGSHRAPMMARANQTPAFDVVRVRVTR